MPQELHNCGRMVVRESPIEGYGVFALEDIKAGEILEEVPFVLFPRFTDLGKILFNSLKQVGFISEKEVYLDNLRKNLDFKDPEKYYFKWIPPVSYENSQYLALPLGYGPIYNTSNANNNAGWRVNRKTFTFSAEREILAGEEIRTFYGYFVCEKGQIWDCDSVLNLAFEKMGEYTQLFGVKFSSSEDYQKAESRLDIKSLIEASKRLQNPFVSSISMVTADKEFRKLDFALNTPPSIYFNELKKMRGMSEKVKLYLKGRDSVETVLIKNG